MKFNFGKDKKLDLSKEELELVEDWLGNKYAGDITIPDIVGFSLETDIEDLKIVNYLVGKVREVHNKKH